MNGCLLSAAANYAAALVHSKAIESTPVETIGKIEQVEDRIRRYQQIEFRTEHVFHAGMYSRTVRVPANVVFTSVLVKRPTMIVANGVFDVLSGEDWVRMSGYNVIPASAWRKQIYVTRTAVELTMMFPTDAKTVEEAEAEFTDDADKLLSRTEGHDMVIVTGVD